MSILLALFYFGIFTYVIFKHKFFKNSGLSTWISFSIFAVKVLASFVLYYIYTRYYPVRVDADLFKYYDDGNVIFSSLKHSITDYFRILTGIDDNNPSLNVYYDQMLFWDKSHNYGMLNDNRTIIRLNAIVSLFSFGSIFVHSVFASFISLCSYMVIYRVIIKIAQRAKYIIAAAVFIVPSTIFWTSGMLKECVLMFGVALFLYAMYTLSYQKINFKKIVFLLLSLMVLLSIKIYVALFIVPAGIAFFLTARYSKIKPILFYGGIFVLSIMLILLNEMVLHAVPFLETLSLKRNDFIMDAAYYAHAKSYLTIGFLDSTPLAFLQDTPLSFYRALFLPWVWSTNSVVEILPAIENLILLILIGLSIAYPFKNNRQTRNFIYFAFFFSVTLLWIIGITTPVIGAIVRYKVPILPFLYTIFALIIDWKRILTKSEYGTYQF